MAKYRKKPVEVDGEQFFLDEYHSTGRLPEGVCACALGDSHPHIHTLEGLLYVNHLDWVMKGTAGEYYPVKPHIFPNIYEAV